MSAVLPQLVEEEDLLVANTVATTGGSIANVVGQGLGAGISAVTGGTFAVVDTSGATREMTQEAAVGYTGRQGTEHNVINRSGRVAIFVEIELKG